MKINNNLNNNNKNKMMREKSLKLTKQAIFKRHFNIINLVVFAYKLK
jgi:hypothetical protein